MADPTNEELAERLEDMAGAAPRRDAFSKTDTETCRLAAARLRQPLPSGDEWTKIEDDLTASREREKKLAEALGGMPCLLDLINTTVAQCAVTMPDCSACRALAAHREAGE